MNIVTNDYYYDYIYGKIFNASTTRRHSFPAKSGKPLVEEAEDAKKPWMNRFSLLASHSVMDEQAEKEEEDVALMMLKTIPVKGILRKPEAKYAKKSNIQFNKTVLVGLAHCPEDYNRKGDYIAKRLTAEEAMVIKIELNMVKSEMAVHEDSKIYTQFYKV